MAAEPQTATSRENHSDGPKHRPLDVAIVGGGVIGIITALGLVHRGMRVTVYERGKDFHVIGTTLAFSCVAQECLRRLDPSVLEVFRRVARTSPNDTIRYWDGFHPRTKEAAEREETSLLFSVPEGELAYWAALRSDILLAMAAELPEGTVLFGKQLEEYVDGDASEKVLLRFLDGSTAEADVVIGCDGIHSTTRKLLLGADHPASTPEYTHKTVFRALVSLPGAIAALGPGKAGEYCFHMGPGAHMITFPLHRSNGESAFSIFLSLHSPSPWPDPMTMNGRGTREEIAAAFRGWGPHIRELVGLLPAELNKLGVFDLAGHPPPTYAAGRVCVAGDAAHACSPFHGTGAGMGVEDALVLAELLGRVQEDSELQSQGRVEVRVGGSAVTVTGAAPAGVGRARGIEAALQAFSAVRMERTRFILASSRDMGELYQWRYPAAGEDSAKIKAQFRWRARKIWDYDVGGMVAEANKKYEEGLERADRYVE